MTCHLNIYQQYHSPPTRNINRIILMFSLTNHLEITINGETKDLDNHIAIIGRAEDIKHAQQAIISLIKGSKQGNVYGTLERTNRRKRVSR